MSPRAAWRLESLGFTEVYDYAPGEVDWLAEGMPMEGEQASLARVGALARQDVPRCGLLDRIGNIRQRVEAAGWDVCVVVNDQAVVLGLLRSRQLAGDPEATAGEVMQPGPTTYRPDTLVTDAAKRLRERRVAGVLVTRSDGKLIGWLRREDAEAQAGDAAS
ncbi:MAG TPA: CBS domain-containing protein [Chloroflexota bacterium]